MAVVLVTVALTGCGGIVQPPPSSPTATEQPGQVTLNEAETDNPGQSGTGQSDSTPTKTPQPHNETEPTMTPTETPTSTPTPDTPTPTPTLTEVPLGNGTYEFDAGLTVHVNDSRTGEFQ